MDAPANTPTNLVSIAWDSAERTVTFEVNFLLILLVLVLLALLIVWRLNTNFLNFQKFEIDQAEIGIGNSKFSFSPNSTDKQVAYSIWVELSTRKIGLEIDLEDDVIAEIYDSWFNFFTVTRELIKDIPVNRFRRDSTQAIVKLSIEVLNEGLRPHLTKWQARYRRWYERELKRCDEGDDELIDPQEIQKRFPEFEALQSDLDRVNISLIKYRAKMRELVLKD